MSARLLTSNKPPEPRPVQLAAPPAKRPTALVLTGRRPRAALVHGAAGWRLGAAPARAGLQAGGLSCVLSVAPALQMPVLSRLYSPYRRARLRSAVLQLAQGQSSPHRPQTSRLQPPGSRICLGLFAAGFG